MVQTIDPSAPTGTHVNLPRSEVDWWKLRARFDVVLAAVTLSQSIKLLMYD